MIIRESIIGRFQTEEESNQISNDLKNYLNKLNIPFLINPGTKETGDFIVDQILKYLKGD